MNFVKIFRLTKSKPDNFCCTEKKPEISEILSQNFGTNDSGPACTEIYFFSPGLHNVTQTTYNENKPCHIFQIFS